MPNALGSLRMSDTKDLQVVDVQETLKEEDVKDLFSVLARRFNTTRKNINAIFLDGMNQAATNGGHGIKSGPKESAATTKQYEAIEPLRERYDIIKIESIDRLFYKEKISNENTIGWDDSKIFRVFPLPRQKEKLMESIEQSCHIRLSDAEAEAAAKTMLTSTKKRRRFVDNTVIQITNNLFWDGAVGALTDKPSGESFRRLFDTDIGDENTIKWTPEQEAEWNDENNEAILKGYYKRSLAILNEYGGKFPQNEAHEHERGGAPWLFEHLPYIRAWADDNYDTYMDLLRAIASCFLKKKPKAGYFLIGNTRNGKSTFTALIRTIFGQNNSARVPLDDLTDPHLNDELATAVVNAPDEQEDVVMEKTSYFKQMSAHEGIKLKVMYSKEGLLISCDFMCFYPMNHMPKWTGSGAEACVKRCWPIFFTHDFSGEDSKTTNFNRDTYTPENMKMLIPVVLALAAYHSTHPLKPSETMEGNKGLVEGVTSPASAYRKKFLEYFSGVENMKVLVRDYKLWCRDNEMNWGSREDLLNFIRPLIMTYGNGRNRKNVSLGKRGKVSCYLFKSWGPKNACVLHEGFEVPGYVARPTKAGEAERDATLNDLHCDWDGENDPPARAKSVLTALDELKFREQHPVTTPPDQLPPEKPKSSAQWLKERGIE